MQIEEKRWDKGFEEAIYSKWKKNKAYEFYDDPHKTLFAIDTPPPYVNTPVHIGHATTYTLMDMFARFKRMTGHKVIFPLGLDRNGLPIEMAAEKKFNIKLCDMSREDFVAKCEQLLEESSAESVDSFLKLGISFSSWEEKSELGGMYLTDSDEYRTLTQATFIDLWNKGLIYEDNRINNFCPGCGTTIADSEIEYANKNSKFNDVIFKVKETGEEIIIGTTRPELICTCRMIIFNPEDERYKHLDGKTAITPIYKREIPIKAHPQAEINKGTGLVMMCSAGDLSDIRFFREMNLEPVIAINMDGAMNSHAGILEGLKVRDAREKIIETLKEKGLLIKQTDTVHRTPICERSGDEIEFIAMKEFYLKQLNIREDMKKIADKVNFFAPQSRQILHDWIDSLATDWPISRRRYYATEIPLWYCEGCGEALVPEKGKYYRPWKEKAPFKECPKCKGTKFRGEERVFDTWFDSSNSPLYILGYMRNQKFFDNNALCTLRPQGKEIIRTWLYYTLLKGYLLTGTNIFRDAWINYHILDDQGIKMSKSKGNVIDPHDILEKFGAEPFRLWSATEGNLEKTDFRCSYERIESNLKTLTKLWNVSRFISGFEWDGKEANELMEIDKWILKELNEIVKFANGQYEEYDFHNPAIRVKSFLWNEFASHYLEMAKSRAYNTERKFTNEEQQAALYTLHTCLDTILKLLAPITPYITSMLFEKLREKDVHLEEFPKYEKNLNVKIRFETEELVELNSSIWSAKKDAGKPLNSELEEFTLDKKWKAIEKTLTETHKIKKLVFK